jgi:hypothetical protein
VHVAERDGLAGLSVEHAGDPAVIGVRLPRLGRDGLAAAPGDRNLHRRAPGQKRRMMHMPASRLRSGTTAAAMAATRAPFPDAEL